MYEETPQYADIYSITHYDRKLDSVEVVRNKGDKPVTYVLDSKYIKESNNIILRMMDIAVAKLDKLGTRYKDISIRIIPSKDKNSIHGRVRIFISVHS